MGKLYILATPIGNLSDISLRALNILKEVDLVLAEDTRHTAILLNSYQINTNIRSLHEHNEIKELDNVLLQLINGKKMALVSDAGTPTISDPGYLLVKSCHEKKISVVPIPGACAAIAALSVSGLPSNKFIFIGFLNHNTKQAILKQLKNYAYCKETLIFYESSKRVLNTIKYMSDIFGDKRKICLAKELTKVFENVITDTIPNIYNWLCEYKNNQKGEFVIVVTGYGQNDLENKEDIKLITLLLENLLEYLPLSKSAKIVAKISGISKNRCYQIAENIKNSTINH